MGPNKKNYVTCVLFLDLSAAFDSVFRQLAMHHPMSDERVIHIMRTANFPDHDIAELFNAFSKDTALAEAGASPHVQQLVAMCHNSTWFSTQGAIPIASSKKGTKAGGPSQISFSISSLPKSVERFDRT